MRHFTVWKVDLVKATVSEYKHFMEQDEKLVLDELRKKAYICTKYPDLEYAFIVTEDFRDENRSVIW